MYKYEAIVVCLPNAFNTFDCIVSVLNMLYSLRFLQFSFSFLAAAALTGCPPDGPLLPHPRNLLNSSAFQNATISLEHSLEAALNGAINSGFSVPNTFFSIGLVSFDSPTSQPIWVSHHRGSANINGTERVDGDSQYLIGSLSKVVSDLLYLRTGIDFSTPIVKCLPELAEDALISWQDINVASLADHLGGIPPNYGFSEFYYLKPLLERLGFPSIGDDQFANCGIAGLNGDCSEEQILEGMLTQHPITSPNQRPVYSQLSFTLIYFALKAALNMTYPALLDEYINQPLGLNNTGASPGNASRAVIPPVDNSWGSSYGEDGVYAPGGGLYSSLNDISALVHSILRKEALSTEAEVRNWLKPRSFTSSPYSLVGRPWEIFRTANLTPEHPHTIDIYGKNGGANGYISQMVVVDQYGVGIVVLNAGSYSSASILYEAMLSTFLPAVEEEARAQA